MRWLIDYIRSCFCKHDWELLQNAEVWDKYSVKPTYPIGGKWTYRCKKCCRSKVIKNY